MEAKSDETIVSDGSGGGLEPGSAVASISYSFTISTTKWNKEKSACVTDHQVISRILTWKTRILMNLTPSGRGRLK